MNGENLSAEAPLRRTHLEIATHPRRSHETERPPPTTATVLNGIRRTDLPEQVCVGSPLLVGLTFVIVEQGTTLVGRAVLSAVAVKAGVDQSAMVCRIRRVTLVRAGAGLRREN